MVELRKLVFHLFSYFPLFAVGLFNFIHFLFSSLYVLAADVMSYILILFHHLFLMLFCVTQADVVAVVNKMVQALVPSMVEGVLAELEKVSVN